MSRFGDRLKKMLGSYYSDMGSSKSEDKEEKEKKKPKKLKRWKVVIKNKDTKKKKNK